MEDTISYSPVAEAVSLEKAFHGRSKEIGQLDLLFGSQPYKNEVISPLCLYGAPGTGKTSLLSAFLKGKAAAMRENRPFVPFVLVNSFECFTLRSCFTTVLRGLWNGKRRAEALFEKKPMPMLATPPFPVVIDKFTKFRKWFLSACSHDLTNFIIFRHAEALRAIGGDDVSLLTTLSDCFRPVRVCVIFVSSINPESVFSLHHKPPISLFFPEYEKSAVVLILMKEFPTTDRGETLGRFLSLVYDVCAPVTLSLYEMRRISHELFVEYRRPLLDGGDVSIGQLYNRILPLLRRSLFRVESPVVPSNPLDSDVCFAPVTRYLLFAGFLASHNPQQFDRQFFPNETGTKRLRIDMGRRASESERNQDFSALAFSAERLLTIFRAICDPVPFEMRGHSDIQRGIAALESLNLLQRVSVDNNLDILRYRCNASLSYVEKLAASGEVFSIHNFLLR